MSLPIRETIRGILINPEDELGLVYSPKKDRFETAGGGRNGSKNAPHEKENAWECLKREVREETGYEDFRMIRYLGCHVGRWNPRPTREEYSHIFLIGVNGSAGPVQLDPEEGELELKWMTPEEILALPEKNLKPRARTGVEIVAYLMENGWDAELHDKIIYSPPPRL